jgi:hypothetical protein
VGMGEKLTVLLKPADLMERACEGLGQQRQRVVAST